MGLTPPFFWGAFRVHISGPGGTSPAFGLSVCKNMGSWVHTSLTRLPRIAQPGSSVGGPSGCRVLPAALHARPHPACSPRQGHRDSGTEGREQIADSRGILREATIKINARSHGLISFLCVRCLRKCSESNKRPDHASGPQGRACPSARGGLDASCP